MHESVFEDKLQTTLKAVRTIPLWCDSAGALEAHRKTRQPDGANETGAQTHPPDHHQVIRLCDVEEMTYKPIVTALDLPIGTRRAVPRHPALAFRSRSRDRVSAAPPD